MPVGAPADADASSEKTEPVYDIKVEDPHLHEFFANGILVHNTEWVPGTGASPNRVDAMVWAATALDKRAAKAHIGSHRHLRSVG